MSYAPPPRGRIIGDSIQATIDKVAAQGGGIVHAEGITYECENIVLRPKVMICGEGKQVTRFKLKDGARGDVFRTQAVDVLWGTNSLNGATFRWGLRDLTIDGNAAGIAPNATGRGIYSWSTGITIQDVHILNCKGLGWQQGAPLNWLNLETDVAGETRAISLSIQRCGQRGSGDVPNGVGNGGFYYNGPTDARFTELFVGWCEGGYSVKIGPNGASRFLGGELWGGGYPGVSTIYWPKWAIISEALNGVTAVGLNLSGGTLGQALIRRNGFRHWNAHNYLVAGNGVVPSFVQKGYQIGDAENGFTEVAGVRLDVEHEDILGPTIDFNSDGGFNDIRIRGYTNYSNMPTACTGERDMATNELDIRVGGLSPVRLEQAPA